MAIAIGEKVTAGSINEEIQAPTSALPLGIIAYYQRTTVSAGFTGTEVGITRLDNIQVYAGRAYSFTVANLSSATTVAGDAIRFNARYAIGGTASTGSTTLGIGRLSNPTTANGPVLPYIWVFPAVTTGLLSVLLTAIRASGTGTYTVFASTPAEPATYMVQDMGLLPTSIGVNVT